MINFKAQDYKDILFGVHNLKKGMNVFEAFPTLAKYEEFKLKVPSTMQFENVFKYIVFVYDQKSPFYTQIEDIIERKKKAALEAGFMPKNYGGFSDDVKRMLNCENNNINQMIIRYCRIQSKDFTGLIASQEAYYQINLQLITVKSDDEDPIKTAKVKAELDKLAEEVAVRLDEKARRFLSQETMEGIYVDLWSLAEKESVTVKISPEDYAV